MKTKLTMILAAVVMLSSCSKTQYGYFSNSGSSSNYAYKAKSVDAPATEEAQAVEVATVETEATELFASTAATAAPVAANAGLKHTAKAIEKVAAGETLSAKEQTQVAVEVKKELKKAEKQAKEESADAASTPAEGKSQVIALVLALLVGYVGIHRFYLGYTTQGLIQLLTLGGCGIWSLIDLVRIITGDLKPKGGDYTQKL